MSADEAALLPGVEEWSAAGHFAVYDYGAHVWAWQPEGHHPVIWMSPRADLGGATAIRGGVPVIFPWFGAGRDGTAKPAHGFVRTIPWVQEFLDATDDELVVRYRIDPEITGDQPLFPYRYRATLRVNFTATAVEIALGVFNEDEQPFTFEQALHTYLAVGDVRQIVIDGLVGTDYFDKVSGSPEHQETPVTMESETDRIYASEGTVVVNDPVWERSIRVEKSGSADTVIWNPWADKAAAMADLGADAWSGFVCVEAANTGANAVELNPGESHALHQRISLG